MSALPLPANAAGPVAWQVPAGTRPTVKQVTAEILRHLWSGRPAIDARPGQPHLLAGGDLGPNATTATTVWGGGLSGPSVIVPMISPDRVLAVRGQLTADRMVAAGLRLRDIPFGDPGILAGRLLERDFITDAAPIAVVPSSAGRRHPFFATLRNSREACVVDLDRTDLSPLREIAGSEVVVAQDLHGLIYAEAFDRPAVWIADRSDADHDFRFRDWFSTVWERPDRPVMLGGRLDRLADIARRLHYARDRSRLAEMVRQLP